MYNVLVTGGAGFIGHHVIGRLCEKGYRVIVVDNLSKENPSPLDNNTILSNNAISFYTEDIRNQESISLIIRQESVDTCIHLAAKVGVYDSIVNPYDAIDVNVKGTLNLLEACYQNKVQRFVFISSAAVYGDPKRLPLSEDDVLRPQSLYGVTKASAEMLVCLYKKLGKIRNVISLRLFNVYGKYHGEIYGNVIKMFAERLSKGLPPIIYGNGQQTRDFISVNDVVNAIILAVEELEKNFQHQSTNTSADIFNIGTGISTTVNEIAQKMTKIFDLKLEPIHCEAKKGEIKYSYADVTRAKNILKFIACDKFDSNLIQTLILG